MPSGYAFGPQPEDLSIVRQSRLAAVAGRVREAMARKSNAQQRALKRAEQERLRREAERKRNIRNVVVGAVLAGLVVAFAVLIWPEPHEGDTTAEAWDLPQLDGEGRVALADFVGKPTVAAFFASWCEVCEREIPEYLALSREIGDEVNFVGINTLDNGNGLNKAEEWGIAGEWPLARDIGNGNGSALGQATFGARGMPMTVIYDEQGVAVQIIQRGLTDNQLLELLEQFTGFET
jgi:thiol-disulfide isomerase/thioredoxin